MEVKHHKLARSLRSGGHTRELKPTSTVRDALNTILSYPPTTALSTEEQDLIWKYRFYLSSQKKALTKFVKCVNWKVAGEERQALEMLALWAPPDRSRRCIGTSWTSIHTSICSKIRYSSTESSTRR